MSANDFRSDGALPLSGIRVIDFTQVMMGPVCTQMLGDYGADVIKIERAGAGDLSRSTFPPEQGVDNPIFCSLNRNKRSVALDLRSAESMAAVKALHRRRRRRRQQLPRRRDGPHGPRLRRLPRAQPAHRLCRRHRVRRERSRTPTRVARTCWRRR
jgi:hypothetical protein